MRIALSGSHGFVGQALIKALRAEGHEIWPMVRKTPAREHEIFFDPHQQLLEKDKLARCDAVINLAGKNIMKGVWTASFKKELRESRVLTTKLIANALASIKEGPRIMLNASAVGFYGDSGEREVDENAQMGQGFLAELCRDWEHASDAAKDAGIRVVNLRFANVLGPHGGLLAAMEPAFKLGFGPMFGSGKHYMPLVALDDLAAAVIFALKDAKLFGPTNVVCSLTPTNEEFSLALAKALKSHAWLHVPAWSLKLLGEQGSMLLNSCRPVPAKLAHHGFRFAYPNIETIMRHIYA